LGGAAVEDGGEPGGLLRVVAGPATIRESDDCVSVRTGGRRRILARFRDRRCPPDANRTGTQAEESKTGQDNATAITGAEGGTAHDDSRV